MLLFYTDPNNIGMAGASFQWLEEFFLTDDQQHHLAWRVLHLYLRVFGNDNVGLRSMTTQFLKVVDVCRGNGWWKEMLDASILWSDYVQHTRQPDECQVQYFGKICEALQMNNRFREAAELYGQLASDYGSKLADKRQLVEAYMNQGGSYKRCANFDDAEVALLNGFRALFTSFNLNNAFTLSPAVNITFYGLLARHISECYQFRLDNPDNSEVAFANETLVLLLSMSQLAGCSIPALDRVPADKIVKSQFNAKGAARKALAAAFKTDTVDEFYQVLRSWKQPGASVEVTATNKFKQGRDYTTAKGIKHGSRDEIRAGVRTDSCLPKRKCYYPNCPEGYMAVEKLSQCSKCKIAQYCSRDCQAAHWKEHKLLCTAARQG
ncbi:hypothetical protein MPSEU_001091500 [Mayamaea pseudoterrestris]|nr:hypothetical protein MPSEU_001091500 [Mayamaea pseudoterrestris]